MSFRFTQATRRGRLSQAFGLLSFVAVLAATSSAGTTTAITARPPSVRFVDLNSDGLADMLTCHPDHLTVALNRDGGVFDEMGEQLPAVDLNDVLVSDLDGDGLIDLYLVSSSDNVALRGDGTGHFIEATEALGLADHGHGVSAERLPLDSFGADELLLHNADGDTLFWATANGFQRASLTPAVAKSGSAADSDLATLEQLLAGAAELLALDPSEELVLSIDSNGRPQVALGRQSLDVDGLPPGSNGPLGTSGAKASAETSATTAAIGGFVSGNSPSIAALTTEEQEILDTMSIVMLDDGAGNLVNKTVRFTGVNVQVVNGLGATNGNTNNPMTTNPPNTTVNGVGNLIVGYNELGNSLGDARTGSHNVVLGQANSYPAFGGFLGGRNNTISGFFASVSGGEKNNAKARFGSISGGKSNTVKGSFTSVSGGTFNTAIGQNASISGGQNNKASGFSSWAAGGKSNLASSIYTSVSGGRDNTASNSYSSVSGGRANTASALDSSVSGGYLNMASGSFSSVSGGRANTASALDSSVSGGYLNMASGTFSIVSGGQLNTASGAYTSVSGGGENQASGMHTSISGGQNNSTSGSFSSISGGQSNTASGTSASVSGGLSNTASGRRSSVSGGLLNSAFGNYSSVSGGYANTASNASATVSGGFYNTASGYRSSVSGGNSRTAANTDDWVAGTLLEDN